MKSSRPVSLWQKLVMPTVFVGLAVAAVAAWTLQRSLHQKLELEIRKRAEVIVATLGTLGPEHSDDAETLLLQLKTVPEIKDIAIAVDPGPAIAMSTRQAYQGMTVREVLGEEIETTLIRVMEHGEKVFQFRPEKTEYLYLVRENVFGGSALAAEVVIVFLDGNALTASTIRERTEILATMVIAMLIFLAFSTYMQHLGVVRPIGRLMKAVRARIADQEPIRLPELGNDEIGLLAETLDRAFASRQKIQEFSDKLALIASRTDNTVAILDPEGRVEWVNESFTRVTGYTLDEMQGKRLSDVLDGPTTDREASSQVEAAMLAGEPARGELLKYKKSGESYWTQIEAQPILNARGELVNILRIDSDITERKTSEEALRRGRELLNGILNSSVSGVLALQSVRVSYGEILDFSVLQANETMGRLMRAETSELVGRNLSQFLPFLCAADTFPNLVRVAETGGIHKIELKVSLAGEPRWLEVTAARFGDGITLTISDITLRKDAEEERGKLAALVENSPDFIGLSTPDGTILYGNVSGLQMMGLPAGGTLVGQTLRALWAEDQKERFDQFVWPAVMAEGRWEGDTRFHKADGTTIDVHQAIFQVRDPESETVISTGTICRDITKLMEAERLLRQSEELYRSVIRATQDGIWDWRLETNEIYFSPRWKEQFGYEDDELPNEWATLERLLYPEDLQESLARVNRHINFGEPFQMTFRGLHKDGSIRYVLSRGFALRDSEGRAVRMVGSHSDLTEQRLIEDSLRRAVAAAEAADRAKSEFLAVMSHEIRTPMNGILGFTNLLLDSKLDDQQREFLDTIRISGEALLHLLNDILDFSKIESGRLELETVPVCVRALVEDVLDLVSQAAAAKGLDLAAIVDERVPDGVFCDPARLRQVLMNFVSNAVKFTREGQVTLRCGLVGHVVQGDAARVSSAMSTVRLKFEVIDTGIGIEAEKMTRLFKPFSQVDSSVTRQFGGTGLGLAICKRLVELMGGTVAAASKAGAGSTFTFELPAGVVSGAPGRITMSREALSAVRNYRVLVAEPAPNIREMLRTMIMRWGIECKTAADGEMALTMLRDAGPFALLIVNSTLPDMTATHLAAAARGEGEFPALRCVFMTGIAPVDASRGEGGLFDATVLKPVGEPQLLKTVVGLLTGAEVRTADLTETMGVVTDAAGGAEPRPVPELVAGLTVLAAEDNPVNLKLLLLLLKRMGIEARTATDGLQALHSAMDHPVDVILMDIQMPEMDGKTATEHLRASNACGPSGRPVYVIALTAEAMPGDREECLAAGMDDYLTKPVRPAELKAALERCQQAIAQFAITRL